MLRGKVWSGVYDAIGWGSWAINGYRQETSENQICGIMEALVYTPKNWDFPY